MKQLQRYCLDLVIIEVLFLEQFDTIFKDLVNL